MLRISPDIIISFVLFFFFFQAEDGIRDWSVTGVQTCALPISYAVFCLRTEQHTTELPRLTNFVCGLRFRKEIEQEHIAGNDQSSTPDCTFTRNMFGVYTALN